MMNKLSMVALLLAATVALAAASPSSSLIKETWLKTPQTQGWQLKSRADPSHKLELTVAVKQTNVAELEATLLRKADPDNVEEYGKWLSKEEVEALVAPKPESVEAVTAWLVEQGGVSRDALRLTGNGDFVVADVTVEVAERLLHAEYFTFEHETTGVEIVRVNGRYSLPAGVHRHVDFVGPTVRFPTVRLPVLKENKPNGLGGIITPAVLRDLYQVGSYSATNPKNIQACASFLGQFYSPQDLQSFFQQFDKESVGRTAELHGPNEPSNPGVEASLDIEYIMAMGNNVSTQFWSTAGQQPHSPQNEPFLKWLLNVANMTQDQQPLTISVSYGDNEDTVNYDYAVRVNTEFQKAGVRGTSIMFSSGDGGVAGGQTSPCTKFIPTYPAGSPWVTAVGGTASSKPEVAASFSSGGFSNYWPRPSYQDAAVKKYFQVAKGLPASDLYNHTGAGIPDVSAQSESFNVVQGGSVVFGGVDGTSCSSPSFAGIISLLNDVRLNAGKSPLGFLNPLIYKHPEVFNDVTSGNNPGCGTNGFNAAAEWDPVTGYGTPNFPKLVALVKSLP